MSEKRLLFVYAHPDDESFGSGGVIARYAAEGVAVYLICATHGDAGTVSPHFLRGFADIAALRVDELRRAAAVLGIRRYFTFGYRDSGMMNTPDNDHPDSLWQAPLDEVTRKVVEVMREVKPQVVVTFNKFGGYGHPDHIAIQRAAVQAFQLAGDASYETGQAPYQPQKLYYSRMAVWLARLDILLLRLKGHDPRRLGRNKDIDRIAILEHVEPKHTLIDVRRYFGVWQRANAEHASQGGASLFTWSAWVRWLLAGKQSFTRIQPVPQYNRGDESDFFDEVVTEW